MLILPPTIDFMAISPGLDPQWQQRSPGDPAGKANDANGREGHPRGEQGLFQEVVQNKN